jgi:D-alanine-D-alanine ligase
MGTAGMRVLVLYNMPVLQAGHAEADSESEIIGTAEAVRRILNDAGFEVACLGLTRDIAALPRILQQHRPEVVFNLFEGLADDPRTEAEVARVVEQCGIPLTGCPSRALDLGRDKLATKRLFQKEGLRTPDFYAVDRLPPPACRLPWPVIVKPGLYDASVGIDQGSVVTGPRLLDRRVGYLWDCYGPPVLVEEYIPGREFTISLVETPDLRTLPVLEILFEARMDDGWPILTYDGKWRPGSPDYDATPPRYAAPVEAELSRQLADAAQRAFRLLGCRGYARVDFRVCPEGNPYILELNPNPDLSPDACLAGSLRSAALSYDDFIVGLIWTSKSPS